MNGFPITSAAAPSTTVVAADGREWNVRRRRSGLVLVLGMLVVSWLLLVWLPNGVHVPCWLYAGPRRRAVAAGGRSDRPGPRRTRAAWITVSA